MIKKIFLSLILVNFVILTSHAQMGFTTYPTEYQVKAKYLYNFARFVEWPDQSFTHKSTPYTIGILGEDPFGIDLDKTVEGKKIKGRNFIIKRFNEISDFQYCHILFISLNEQEKTKRVIKKLKGSSILTVSDIENFAEDGGIINFFMTEEKIRFKINFQSANASNLKISSQILRQAKIITNKNSEK